MRAYIELSSHITALKSPSVKPSITQVEMGNHNLSDKTAVNGRYALAFPDGVSFEINSNSYVLPVDGNDLSSRGFAELLAKYPMFGHIHFNPILSDQDLLEFSANDAWIDPNVPAVNNYPRFQTGRAASGVDDGNSPVSTALLSTNNTVTPSKPGLIVTDPIDISNFVGTVSSGGGTDQFMVYWKIFSFQDSHDILSRKAAFGKHGELNQATLKQMIEVDQEPADLSVYISIDNGITWFRVSRLQVISFCCKVDNFRLAFVNTGDEKVYLANYAVLF